MPFDDDSGSGKTTRPLSRNLGKLAEPGGRTSLGPYARSCSLCRDGFGPVYRREPGFEVRLCNEKPQATGQVLPGAKGDDEMKVLSFSRWGKSLCSSLALGVEQEEAGL